MSPPTLSLLPFLLLSSAHALTAVPSSYATPATTSSPSYAAAAAATPFTLSSLSLSYAYTYTTASTLWHAPSFATATPVPTCGENLCPGADGSVCADEAGVQYGVLCQTFFSGGVITTSGRRRKDRRAEVRRAEDRRPEVEVVVKDDDDAPLVKRSFTGSFAGCMAFCDAYDARLCKGVSFREGYCIAYDGISGTFQDRMGGFAAVRRS